MILNFHADSIHEVFLGNVSVEVVICVSENVSVFIITRSCDEYCVHMLYLHKNLLSVPAQITWGTAFKKHHKEL
jgi:hypothetical protein